MTKKVEWFRNTEWNASIAEAFHAKLARARSGRDQYLVIQAMTLVHMHPKVALELADFFLETGDQEAGVNRIRGLEARAEALGELKRGDEMCATYREVFAMWEAMPSLGGLARFHYPMYVARLKISDDYDLALTKSHEAKDILGSPQGAFLKSAARGLIYGDQGRTDAARINADMAVRFGNIRRKGLSVSYDSKVIIFNDKPTLKRLFSILRKTLSR